MKKNNPDQLMEVMLPFCCLLKKEAHFDFRHLLSVYKRLKTKVSKHIINEYKRLDGVIVFKNQGFVKIIKTVAIVELRL